MIEMPTDVHLPKRVALAAAMLIILIVMHHHNLIMTGEITAG
jgi:hypothetical protein